MIRFGKPRHKISTILKCIRLYPSYPLSYREIEEIMMGDGVKVDHLSIHLWVRKFTPLIFQKKEINQ